ncbi:MAG: hypothetical protein DRI46_13805 [Chloroflexi bacterium]|nr:MAG: hypothetical protein DRI46_13805 [Chloroflexota bacterium]
MGDLTGKQKRKIKKVVKTNNKIAAKKTAETRRKMLAGASKGVIKKSWLTGKAKPTKDKSTAGKANRKKRNKSIRTYNANKKDACATGTCGGALQGGRKKRR